MSSSAQPHSYVNPGSVLAVVILFPILAAISNACRIWSRRLKNAGFGSDDYLSFAALIMMVGCSIDLGVGRVHHTVGYRSPPGAKVDFNKLQGIILLNKVELSFNLMWCVGITLVKLSFLFFYRRIFRGKIFKIVNWITMGLVLSWGIAFFLVVLFMCHGHIDQIWNPLPPFLNNKCMSSVAIMFANSLTSCFLDVVILIIPMPLIWRLNLKRDAKLALTGMFSIGGLCIAASTLRLVLYSSLWWAVISHNKNPHIFGLSAVDDFGIVSLALFWSQVELGVACIACCLPSCKALLSSDILQNLPSTFSAITLGSLRSACGSQGSGAAGKNADRQASESSLMESGRRKEDVKAGNQHSDWEHDVPYYATPGKDEVTMTFSIIEGGPAPNSNLVEAGRVLRTVEIGQTRTDSVTAPHMKN